MDEPKKTFKLTVGPDAVVKSPPGSEFAIGNITPEESAVLSEQFKPDQSAIAKVRDSFLKGTAAEAVAAQFSQHQSLADLVDVTPVRPNMPDTGEWVHPKRLKQQESRTLRFDPELFALTFILLRSNAPMSVAALSLRKRRNSPDFACVTNMRRRKQSSCSSQAVQLRAQARETIPHRNDRWLNVKDAQARSEPRGAQARAVRKIAFDESVNAETVKRGIQDATKARQEAFRVGGVTPMGRKKPKPAAPFEGYETRYRWLHGGDMSKPQTTKPSRNRAKSLIYMVGRE